VAYVDALGLLLEMSSGGSTPEIIYSATGLLAETHEAVGMGRFDDVAPGEMGWLSAVLEAIGEADNKIGGYRESRLMDPVNVGEDIFPVENAQDWEPTGRVAIDGVVYTYTSRGPGRLSGITHIYHGDVVRGARKLHYRDAPVLDLQNPYNAIQLLRRAFLVGTAEGDDLNAVGRNLGVFRYAFLGDDEVYRAIVQALAYNPRGTMHGIRLALDAMVGAGKYELVEDLVRHPCTLYVKLIAALLIQGKAIGHAYLQNASESPLMVLGGVNQIPMVALPCDRGVQETAFWRDMRFLHEFKNVRPSAVLEVDYEGDLGTALWFYPGSNENANVTPGADYVTITDNDPADDLIHYRIRTRPDRFGDEQGWKVSMLFCIPAGYCTNADPNQWGMRMNDGWKEVDCGVWVDGGNFYLTLVDNFAPTGDQTSINRDTWYEVTLEKRVVSRGTIPWGGLDTPQHEIVLSLNGREVSRRPYWLFMDIPGGEDPFASFGSFPGLIGPMSNIRGYVKHVGLQVEARQDFVDGMFLGDVGSVGPTVLSNAPALTFEADDIGKRVITKWSGVANAYGGNNNGVWTIHSRTSATEVVLWGEIQTGASVDTGHPKRIVVPFSTAAFTFPDDLGKKIVVTNSVHGNNGTYTIEKLLQMGTELDLATEFNTLLREKTNLCEVVEAVAFVTEGGLEFHLEPNFDAEVGVYFILSAASNVEAGPVLQVRGEFWEGGAINPSVYVGYSRVLTAQVLLESTPVVEKISDVPLVYNWYPFYLTDPLGFIRDYLDELTAAGVIAEYLVE